MGSQIEAVDARAEVGEFAPQVGFGFRGRFSRLQIGRHAAVSRQERTLFAEFESWYDYTTDRIER